MARFCVIAALSIVTWAGEAERLFAGEPGNPPSDGRDVRALLTLNDEFTGLTAEEISGRQREQERRERIVSELSAKLGKIAPKLAAIRGQLDAAAKDGKSVDVARVYLAALAWCADDVRRCLEAEELEIVEQAEVLLADLLKSLDKPDCVTGRILDKADNAGDPLQFEKNPYFQSVVEAVRPWTTRERSWAKGKKGYDSIPNAWSFSGRGNDVCGIVWSMTRAGSPLRHDPTLLKNALSLFDAIAHLHTDGDFNIDRTAVYGRDPNINRFCLAPALDAWWTLHQTYPDLLPPAKRADLRSALKVLADYQVPDYGLTRLAKRPHVKQPAYPNMDVHHVLIMEFARRLWGEEPYTAERDAFLKILESAIYPMGAWTYHQTQNECFVYHQLNVLFLARYWQLTGDPSVLAMLKKSIPYYPHNVEPAGLPEYYTDACWKHYWAGGSVQGPEVIAGLFDDRQNKRVAEICAGILGYGRGHHAAIAAEFFKPLPSKPLPDAYTIFDTNIQGPRGRYGPWSFAANGRDYGVGYQGKDTFVGCMIADAERRPLPLDAALQVVTTEVRLNHTDNHWKGGRCHSAREKLTTTLGPDFGSLAVRYTVSKPNWQNERDLLLPWQGTQQWCLSKSRLIGLVALEATADEKRAAVHGRIRLGMKREIQQIDEDNWHYGKLRIKIHDHNYAKITSRPSETFYLDKPEKYRSTEITLIDPQSVKAGEQGDVAFPEGTRFHFLIEVYAEGVEAAETVTRITEGPLSGFRFHEPGRQVVLLHNASDKPADVNMPLNPGGQTGITVYEDNEGKGRPLDGDKLQTRLAPNRHLLVILPEPK